MTDIIIGMAAGYNWRDLKPFVVSLRAAPPKGAGYEGRCFLIVGNGVAPASHQMKSWGIDIFNLGSFSEHPIQARFPAAAKIIEESLGGTRYVLTVDTRDIVFQSDPMIWIENHIGNNELIVASEGGSYSGDTPANKENKRRLIAVFGSEAYDRMKDRPVCNGGVVAGTPSAMLELQRAIYDLCPRVPGCGGVPPSVNGWPSDQEILNYLISSEPFVGRTLVTGPNDGFAFLCDHLYHGSTIRTDVLPPHRHLKAHPQHSDIPYAIFHQYLDWKESIQNEYGCNDGDCQ